MQDTEKFLTISVFLFQIVYQTIGLRCYTCIDAVSNEQCNLKGKVVECNFNELSCQNEVRLSEGNRYRITKRCKQKLACSNNQLQSDRPAWDPTQCNPEFTQNSVCRCCCDTDMCNQIEMPCDKNPRCSGLPKLSNGQTTCSNLNFFGSFCRFTCVQGFNLIGSDEVECVEHQRGHAWNFDLPICERATCGNEMPEKPNNSQFRCSDSNLITSVCHFACDVGYKLHGATRVECDLDGSWSSQFPSCHRITCNEDDIGIENGGVVCSDENFFGSVCVFECMPGYSIGGEPTMMCENSGWSNPSPSCIRETCSPPRPKPQNGSVQCTDESNSFSTCTFTCGNPPRENEWDLYGLETASCGLNRETNEFVWTNLEIPCCARKCPPHALVDLFLVLDSSSSVGRENWNRTLFFIKEVIDQFEISENDVLVAAIRYNRFVDTLSEIRIGQYTNKETTIDAIINLPYDGSGTHTGNALEYVLDNMVVRPGNRRNVKDFVFVVTDGISTDDVVEPARRLREFGATVLALGVVNEGGTLEKEDIAEIAGSPETAFLIESGFEGLSLNVADLIEKQMCDDNPCE